LTTEFEVARGDFSGFPQFATRLLPFAGPQELGTGRRHQCHAGATHHAVFWNRSWPIQEPERHLWGAVNFKHIEKQCATAFLT
jgi:hypothetical protein